MDAFEQIVARVFDHDGYWVKQSFKIDLSSDQKRLIGTHTMPRPEIDLLAFRPGENLVHVLECKSYLDSTPIAMDCFNNGKRQTQFKLFNDANRRGVVLNALHSYLEKKSICKHGITLKLGLVAGHVRPSDRDAIRSLFDQEGWGFWDDLWLSERLQSFSSNPYENSLVDMTAKLIVRHAK